MLKHHSDDLVQLFRKWDLDDNGSVDRREFRRGLRAVGIVAPIVEMNQLFDEMDADKSGTIDLDELLDKLSHLPEDINGRNRQPTFSFAAGPKAAAANASSVELTCICICICICTHIRMHMCTRGQCMCAHIHMHTHAHTGQRIFGGARL